MKRAFTIIELLIVIAVIVLLLSILTVAISAASKTSQSASTRTLMGSIKQAMVRFKQDVGYYPPVLRPYTESGPDAWRQLGPPPNPSDSGFEGKLQDWHSQTSLADFLLGYGHHRQDAWGVEPAGGYPEETPRLGIRHPGPDGVWGATSHGMRNGRLDDRMHADILSINVDSGPVLGPYLELAGERLLASTKGDTHPNGTLEVFLPGEGSYDDGDPKVIVDYWGTPLRYYRRVYHPGSLQTNYRGLQVGDRTPTLAEVILLRPTRIANGAAVDSFVADDNGDTTASMELRTADFAIFSAGPDRSFDPTVRYDAQELNADNIVEVGP